MNILSATSWPEQVICRWDDNDVGSTWDDDDVGSTW
jgi:hypothetical protein